MTLMMAQYCREGLPQLHMGNPLIEALPSIMDGITLKSTLETRPELDMRSSKNAPPHVRKYDVDALNELYVPPPCAVSFAQKIDFLLRNGYVGRSLLNPKEVQRVYNIQELVKFQGGIGRTLAGIITLKGTSGMGKSRLTRMILSMLPQVIQHGSYEGLPFIHTQVVWLSVEAPIGGAMKSFLISLFVAFDEALGYTGTGKSHADKIRRTDSYPELIRRFVQLAATHSLGILHIDDIQRIAETGTDKEHIMQIMIRLANVAKFGIVFTGTQSINEVVKPAVGHGIKDKKSGPLGENTLQKEFEVTRRMISEGFIELKRPTSSDDPFFQSLVERLLEYQWLDEPLVSSETLIPFLYDLTAGIPAILILIYKAAQCRALAHGNPKLTPNDLLDAYRRECVPLSRLINQLRNGRMTGADFDNKFGGVFDASFKT